MIMSNKEYVMIKNDYEQAAIMQDKLGYKIQKFLSEVMFFKYFCCCLKVKDELNIPWEDMTVP